MSKNNLLPPDAAEVAGVEKIIEEYLRASPFSDKIIGIHQCALIIAVKYQAQMREKDEDVDRYVELFEFWKKVSQESDVFYINKLEEKDAEIAALKLAIAEHYQRTIDIKDAHIKRLQMEIGELKTEIRAFNDTVIPGQGKVIGKIVGKFLTDFNPNKPEK